MESLNWEVTTGCYRLSHGCNSCPSYWDAIQSDKSYAVKEHIGKLLMPTLRRKPTNYLVAFGSDLFHGDVSDSFLKKVFKIMNACKRHTFEICTKRTERALSLADKFVWTPNIYYGVAVESAEFKYRMDHLRKMPATYKYVSMVPLLGPMGELNLDGIDLVSAVRETWGYKRPCDPQWIDDVEKQCIAQGVEFSEEHYVYENKEAV